EIRGEERPVERERGAHTVRGGGDRQVRVAGDIARGVHARNGGFLAFVDHDASVRSDLASEATGEVRGGGRADADEEATQREAFAVGEVNGPDAPFYLVDPGDPGVVCGDSVAEKRLPVLSREAVVVPVPEQDDAGRPGQQVERELRGGGAPADDADRLFVGGGT